MNADQVKELLSNATPGPWAYKAGNMKHYAFSTDPLEDFGVSLQELHWKHGHHVPAEGNARLIAAAPAVAQWGLEQAQEVARLWEALRSVLDEAWDGQTVYAVDAGTLAKAAEVLWASESRASSDSMPQKSVSKLQYKILEYLLNNPESTARDILSGIGEAFDSRRLLTRLFESKKVYRRGKGVGHNPYVYMITKAGEVALDEYKVISDWKTK